SGGQTGTKMDRDPVLATLTDMQTGTSVTATLLDLSIDSFDARYSIDDSGIRFITNPHDPDSFVSLAFNNGPASWVSNPYTYGATLTSEGLLDAFGLTPREGWQVTTTADS